jgi:hypothetical protein
VSYQPGLARELIGATLEDIRTKDKKSLLSVRPVEKCSACRTCAPVAPHAGDSPRSAMADGRQRVIDRKIPRLRWLGSTLTRTAASGISSRGTLN